MQVTDTLQAGGAERVAVNLANLLSQQNYRSYLCVTRSEGPLTELVEPAVGKVSLQRQARIDLGGLRRLVRFINRHKIQVLHAHNTSLFLAIQASLFPPFPQVIWHNHFGLGAIDEHPSWLYRLFIQRASGVIIVNRLIETWLREKLKFPPHATWYLPNFVLDSSTAAQSVDLPGIAGKRIVCVANLRPEKGHLTLIRAMAHVVAQEPLAHLILVGAKSHPDYFAKLAMEVETLGLSSHITFAGHRSDVPQILRTCDVSVIASDTEAFPLALVEYGKAGLPVVATEVGECPAVLAHGAAGLIVPCQEPEKLAAGLLGLLNSPELRAELGSQLQKRVNENYAVQPIIKQLCQVYEQILAK